MNDDAADEDDDGAPARGRNAGGYTLIYDVVRRFAQPLGIHLEAWEDRIIKTEKGVVRLRPVRDRAEQLFGEEGAADFAAQVETAFQRGDQQQALFPELAAVPQPRGRLRKKKAASGGQVETIQKRESTTLDHVHMAMLLQAMGRYEALKVLIRGESERNPDFLRLANALSALYPAGSEEKRLLDAMLLAAPR